MTTRPDPAPVGPLPTAPGRRWFRPTAALEEAWTIGRSLVDLEADVVVALKGPADVARLVAAAAGPAVVGEEADGWTPLLPTAPMDPDEVHPGYALAAGLSAAAKKRLVLLLWRAGAECGFLALRGSVIEESHTWPAVTAPEHADRINVGNGEALITHADPADPALVRALIRRATAAGATTTDPLTELVDHLGLPSTVLAALDAPEDFAGQATTVEQTHVWRATQDYLDAPATPSTRRRHLFWAIWSTLAALAAGARALWLIGQVLASDVGHGPDTAGAVKAAWMVMVTGVGATLAVRSWRALRRTD